MIGCITGILATDTAHYKKKRYKNEDVDNVQSSKYPRAVHRGGLEFAPADKKS